MTTTVLDRVERAAARAPDVRALSAPGGSVTRAELVERAARAGAGLRELGVAPGDRVVVVLPNGVPFAGALLGCVHAGAIAVPAPTPAGTRPLAFRERLAGIVRDCGPLLLVTTADALDAVTSVVADAVRVVVWDAVLEAGAAARRHPARPTDALLVQYTSGSTGVPRGVVVTHAMADAQCAQAREVYAEGPDDVAVTWVPLFHDMGLVTGVLRPLHTGYRSVLMSPREFAARPRSWLDAIHRHRATLSSAPNFAYDLCARKVRLEPEDPLDLRTWRVARNAGEVVRAATADRFTAAFARAGFRTAAFSPSYGMAEATLTVATCGPATPPRRAPAGVLSSGVPLPGTRVAVRRGGAPVGEGEVGELWVAGPQVFTRYWPDRPAPVEDGWLRTGDLGFVDRGHVFVLGRADDAVVVNGRNFHQHDITEACSAVPGLRPGRSVAVHASDGAVWLVGEVATGSDTSADALAGTAARAREALSSRTGLSVAAVGLLPPGALPLTTSGKVRTSLVREVLATGSPPLVWHD